MDSDLESLVEERIASRRLELPVFPRSSRVVIECSHDADLGRLAETIRTDPTLTAHMLRLANSALSGSRSPIVSVMQAVARLGATQVRNIALVVACRTRMFAARGAACDADAILRSAVATAMFAQEVARARRASVEEAFVAGLLADMGLPALLQLVSDVEDARGQRFGEAEVARVVARMHPEVGAAIATEWSMSPRVADAIRAHHDPLSEASEDASPVVATIQLARALADGALGGAAPSRDELVSLPAVAALNLYDDDLEALVMRSGAVMDAVMALR